MCTDYIAIQAVFSSKRWFDSDRTNSPCVESTTHLFSKMPIFAILCEENFGRRIESSLASQITATEKAMSHQDLPTKFAPANRSCQEEIQSQAEYFSDSAVLRHFSDAVPDILFVLNKNRQIVHANRFACAVIGVENQTTLLGLRPGEALGCRRATEMEGGCGTSEFCRTCGAVRAILKSQRGVAQQEECTIVKDQNEASLDLRVSASPIEIDGEFFALFVATSIADEKRRKVLERVFFHDVLNTASAIHGFLELMAQAEGPEQQELADVARQLMNKLIQEVSAQRELTEAESGEMRLHPVPVRSDDFLGKLVRLYRGHECAQSRALILSDQSDQATVLTDRTLLHRVVGNMIKNALEASARHQTVTVGCSLQHEGVEFWVRNEGCIPRESQLQIFQRSFSTKGTGRGLGTYSMKLLGEKYLGGIVSFSTSLDDGTTFRIRLPITALVPVPVTVERAA